MSIDRARKLGIGSYAILIGAVAIAMLAIGSVLAQLSLNLPGLFEDVIRIMLTSSVIIFAVAVILGAIGLVRRTPWLSPGHPDAGIDALEIARRRYARGEIDQEEFRSLRDDLRAGD